MSDVDDPGPARPRPVTGVPAGGDPVADGAPEYPAAQPGGHPSAAAHEQAAPGQPEPERPADESRATADADGGYSWASPAVDAASTEPPEPSDRPKPLADWLFRKNDVVWALVWTAIATVAGVPLAFLWAALGPHVGIVMTAPDHPELTDYNTEAFVAGDGRYALITGLAGVVMAAVAWILRRGRGPLMVIGLAAGSLAGAWITWKLGTQQGEEEFRWMLRSASAGQHFERNMRLQATGLVYFQALAAVAVYVGCAAWSRYPDLDPNAPSAHPAAEPPLEYARQGEEQG